MTEKDMLEHIFTTMFPNEKFKESKIAYDMIIAKIVQDKRDRLEKEVQLNRFVAGHIKE